MIYNAMLVSGVQLYVCVCAYVFYISYILHYRLLQDTEYKFAVLYNRSLLVILYFLKPAFPDWMASPNAQHSE